MSDVLGRMWASLAFRTFLSALLGGLLLTLQQHQAGENWDHSLTAGAIAAIAAILARGIFEGGYDVRRAINGTTSKADVPNASPKLDVTKVG